MLKVMRVTEGSGWSLVIPVKTLVAAKTRLADAAGPHRVALAVAIACDTVQAALACPRVARVVVVTADPRAARPLSAIGALVVDDPREGLNAALRRGAAEAVRLAPGDPVGALQADLPALRPEELGRMLAAAEEFEQSFLADAAEVGTTFYGTLPGVPFTPGFGGESRARHLARGAKEITVTGIPSLRTDVDTPADLIAALSLGTGPRTRAVARLMGVRGIYGGGVQATVREFDPETRTGSVFLDDGTSLEFGARAFDAGGLRLLRAGQRVAIRVSGGEITAITLSTFPLPPEE